MRLFIMTIAVALATAPAMAAPTKVPPAPKVLTDPAMADQLGNVVGAMARAVMDLPVGEVQAAVENRPVTPADRNRRVRDVATGGDRGVEERIARDAARSGRQAQAMGQAVMRSMPAIIASLERAGDEVERAVANLPDPTYPVR